VILCVVIQYMNLCITMPVFLFTADHGIFALTDLLFNLRQDADDVYTVRIKIMKLRTESCNGVI